MNKKSKFRKLLHKLSLKYRFVIMNEDTFQEHASFKLNRLNVFIALALLTIMIASITYAVIAYTPFREYIPGYSSIALRKDALAMQDKIDSLSEEVARTTLFLKSTQKALVGDIPVNSLNKDSIIKIINAEKDTVNLAPSENEIALREEVDQEIRHNINDLSNQKVKYALFAPAQGTISSGFNIEKEHYAVDVVLDKNTPIKAITDGIVIFAEWTAETGYVIIVKHPNFISVYKHNASLLKKQGEFVKSGTVIAQSGSTGELTTGPHLHFELWMDGKAVDPSNFIDFNK
jgi:murein DD-endopeptidase MepM/ murein hydrolase activator NlpD